MKNRKHEREEGASGGSFLDILGRERNVDRERERNCKTKKGEF